MSQEEATIRIERNPVQSGWRLEACQWLPQPRQRVFEFFSDAFQLETLTPAFLCFQVQTPAPIVVREGLRIDYRLKLHGLPLQWQSEISLWEPPFRFVDEQRRGPYRRWRHEHIFEESDGGTLCRDIVDYSVIGGWLVERLLVRPDLLRIFGYRQAKLRDLFSGSASVAASGGRP